MTTGQPMEPALPPRPGLPGLTSRGPSRYARWDGTQRLDDISAEDLLAELSDDILAESDLNAALARLLQRGIRAQSGRSGLGGLDDLVRRLVAQREELL